MSHLTLYLLLAVVALVVFIALFFVDAGYGKFYNPKWGPSLDNRLGWILMEAPAFLVMLYMYLRSDTHGQLAPLVFLLLFELHYFHRSFVFPFLLRGHNRMPLAIILMGAFFNSGNALLQGFYLFQWNIAAYTDSWLTSPQFLLGIVVFFAGMYINRQSDSIIRHLREPGDTRHYLPDKGLYKYVNSANYFGEFIEWCGFALLTWSPTGVMFALWTFANLAPRAARIHDRYLQEFPEQMQAHPRKRFFPFIW